MSKPKLLIVGDSYMMPDARWLGFHWTERLTDYEIINYAVAGASPTLIGFQLHEGLFQHRPDFVFVGASSPFRLEFLDSEPTKQRPDHPDILARWSTNVQPGKMNDEQRQVYDSLKTVSDGQLWHIRNYWILRSFLLTLEQKKIPYAFGMGDLGKSFKLYDALSIIQRYYRWLLKEFESQRVPFELEFFNYNEPKDSNPLFHVDNEDWQINYAMNVDRILKSQVNKE